MDADRVVYVFVLRQNEQLRQISDDSGGDEMCS